MTRTVVAVLLILSAVGYASWLLEFVLDTGIDPLRGFVSELGATDRRYGFLFRTGDLVTGILVTIAGTLGVWRLRRGWLTVVGWSALLVFAIATILDSRSPMTCAATADAECAARENAGQLPTADALHALTSTAASTGAVVSALAFLAAAYRYGWPHWLRRTGLGVAFLFVGGTVWTLIATGLRGQEDAWLGLGQRVQLVAFSGWLIFVALIAVHTSAERVGST